MISLFNLTRAQQEFVAEYLLGKKAPFAKLSNPTIIVVEAEGCGDGCLTVSDASEKEFENDIDGERVYIDGEPLTALLDCLNDRICALEDERG